MMSAAGVYWAYLLAWVLMHFVWQGFFLVISWRACDVTLRLAPSHARYRIAWLHLTALGAAPILTLLVSQHALAASTSAGASAASRGWGGNLGHPPMLVWSLLHLLGGALPDLLILWLVGVLIAGGYLLACFARHSHVAHVHTARQELLTVVHEVARELGLAHPPIVLEAEVASPFVYGVYQQRLILPREIERQLTPAELRAILAHELAHLKRSDYGSNLLQSMLVVSLWPHPAAWLLWAQTRREREACCDDLAVRVCKSAATLASALYRLAERAPAFESPALAAAAGPLERRMQRLLQPRQPSVLLASWSAALSTLGALALVTFLFAQTLPVDRATLRAFVASPWGPTITIHAHDPAGFFQVKIRQGHVLAVSLGDVPVPPKQVIQRSDVVRVVGRSGQEVLSLTVDPGGGIRWEPRPAGSQSSL